MKTKMIDIFPPSSKEKKSGGNKYYTDKKKKGMKNFIFPAVILLLLLGYLYYTSYKTEIRIDPIITIFEEEKDVLARSLGSLGENEIRARVLEERIKDSYEFVVEETKLVEEKAEGEIEVCQSYRDSSVSFVMGTRFISDKGKLFIAKERFVIPGRTYKEGSVVPGCMGAEVIAAEAGEEYNIPSNSKFSLPGLQGTAFYGRVEGKSIDIKKEGRKEEIPYLEEGEMERVKDNLQKELSNKGMEKISKEYGESYFLESDLQHGVPEIVELKFTEEKEGKAMLELEVKLQVLAISNEEIERYARNLLPEGYIWEKKETNFTFKRANFETEELEFVFGFSANIYEEIDETRIKRNLSGLTFEDAERELGKMINANRTSFHVYPFGLRRVSGNSERINIVLNF